MQRFPTGRQQPIFPHPMYSGEPNLPSGVSHNGFVPKNEPARAGGGQLTVGTFLLG
jgi:hypothetical protein